MDKDILYIILKNGELVGFDEEIMLEYIIHKKYPEFIGVDKFKETMAYQNMILSYRFHLVIYQIFISIKNFLNKILNYANPY